MLPFYEGKHKDYRVVILHD